MHPRQRSRGRRDRGPEARRGRHAVGPPEVRAALALWKMILAVSLPGIFLAELAVMSLLAGLDVPWGWPAALLDSCLLTAIVLPGLYLLVLRPLAQLAARFAAAAADARFWAVVDATADGVVVGDKAGRIRYVNPAVLRMLGYARDELVGAEVARLVPEERRAHHREEMRRYQSGAEPRVLGRGPVEMEALARDGTLVPVELTLSLPTGDEEGLLVAVIRDMRQRRRLGLYEAMLPVCCVCGSIRDDATTTGDSERWSSLEDYVQRRAAARFSHTFCPACLDHYRREHGLDDSSALRGVA